MKTRLWIVFAGCAAVAAGAFGCSGGSKSSGGGGSITLTLTGGVVLLAANASQVFANAEFYSNVTPAPAPFTLQFGTDTCELVNTSTSGNPTVTDLNVGSTVTFVSGATTLVAMKDTTSGISYGLFQAASVPLGADYTIAVSGTGAIAAGTIGTVRVPMIPTLSGTPTLTPGSPANISFTANTGADYITVDVASSDGSVDYICNSKDDGTFTIPADVTTAVGAGADVSLQAIKFNKFDFNGKEVVTAGFTF